MAYAYSKKRKAKDSFITETLERFENQLNGSV
jgi:hypothetical protein